LTGICRFHAQSDTRQPKHLGKNLCLYKTLDLRKSRTVAPIPCRAREKKQLRDAVLSVIGSSNHWAKTAADSELLLFQKLIVVGVSGEQRKMLAGEQLCQSASVLSVAN